MNNITATFGEVYEPVSALLFYKSTISKNTYVEAYDIGFNGNPINAHPLGLKEATTLAKALNNSKEFRRSFLKPKGLLPKNVLYINPDAEGFAVWHTPAMKADLFFEEKLHLPDARYALPPLIWKADKKKLQVFAWKGTAEPEAETELYAAPFFNIHKDAKVCMGTVDIQIEEDTCLEEFIEKWQRYFFHSKFSHLLLSHSPVKGNIIQLYQSLAGTKKKFPLGVLVPNGKTLKNILL
jgi:PRTRC genetic system protein B